MENTAVQRGSSKMHALQVFHRDKNKILNNRQQGNSEKRRTNNVKSLVHYGSCYTQQSSAEKTRSLGVTANVNQVFLPTKFSLFF